MILLQNYSDNKQDHKNINVYNTEGETRHRKYTKLKVGGGQAYDQVTKLSLYHGLNETRQNLLYKAWTGRDSV
jgi:hypothetical protein